MGVPVPSQKMGGTGTPIYTEAWSYLLYIVLQIKISHSSNRFLRSVRDNLHN